MKVAIMQPYFFPYIGYFQLMAMVDVFVFHDDVQFIQSGWVNRNRILAGGGAQWLTFPVQKAPHAHPINQRQYVPEAKAAQKLLRQVEGSYRHAPHFDAVMPMVSSLVMAPERNVARFNQSAALDVARGLGISCQFLTASEMDKDNALAGQDRVLDICSRLGASHYINPIGGLALYEERRFADIGVRLSFLESAGVEYAQSPRPDAAHVPNLSIIDVMMFNNAEKTGALLAQSRQRGAER